MGKASRRKRERREGRENTSYAIPIPGRPLKFIPVNHQELAKKWNVDRALLHSAIGDLEERGILIARRN
jgi:hypothetical protein